MIYATFAGLPAELSPPEAVAERIAAMDSAAEREALWLRIPAPWQPMIGDLARLFIGVRIADTMPDIETRRAALEQVPEIWRDEVRWHVIRLFGTRAERAEYRAAQDAKRGESTEWGKYA